MFDRFFSKPFGLHITDTHIAAAQLSGDGTRFSVASASHLELPAGIVENGRIIDQKKLAPLVTQLLNQAKPKPITNKQCIVALPESHAYEYLFYFPLDLQGDALKNALIQKISETIPVPLPEIKFDYTVYRLPTTQVAFVVAVQRTVIAEYYDLLRNQCGLKPFLFEPESLSIVRNTVLQSEMQNLILIYASNTSVTWFSLWNGIIFDSNRDALSKTVTDQIVKDLKGSEKFFQEKTGQPVQAIVLTGDERAVQELKISFDAAQITSQIAAGPKVTPPANLDNPQALHIPAGLALRNFDLHPRMPIDLLKK